MDLRPCLPPASDASTVAGVRVCGPSPAQLFEIDAEIVGTALLVAALTGINPVYSGFGQFASKDSPALSAVDRTTWRGHMAGRNRIAIIRRLNGQRLPLICFKAEHDAGFVL